MAKITLQDKPCNTYGDLPKPGTTAPTFTFVKTDLSEIKMEDLKGKKIILNIFPSIDTPVCAASVRKFNDAASKTKNTIILCISKDLPFAHARFCGAEGIKNVEPVSDFRNGEFAQKYGAGIVDGPLAGLLARSIVIINEKGQIIYNELVSETTSEPDYESALNNVK